MLIHARGITVVVFLGTLLIACGSTSTYDYAEDNQQRFYYTEYSVLCNSLVDHVRVCKPRFFTYCSMVAVESVGI